MESLLIHYDNTYTTCWDIYINFVLENDKINWGNLGTLLHIVYIYLVIRASSFAFFLYIYQYFNPK
jgi:hypothetical protein